MRIDLDVNELRWLKNCLLKAIDELPADSMESGDMGRGILVKLDDYDCAWFQQTTDCLHFIPSHDNFTP